MNHLPLISHHLFVAAVASEERVRSNRTLNDTPGRNPAGPARSIPLELMNQGEGRPAAAARPLRAIRAASGT